MPVFDRDRMASEIRRDILSSVIRDAGNRASAIRKSLDELNKDMGANIHESTVARGINSVQLTYDSEIPAENAQKYVVGVDSVIRSSLRYPKWGDMKV